ncbi:TlpA family protein disulfide reductase [Laceyella putida]|uniref:TlpA family protein disulfide reductase n=1 Tax=Laceyella putida TaxID=110101 RepID=A0ABW2RLC9_9BACL
MRTLSTGSTNFKKAQLGAIEVYGVNLTGRDSIANVKLYKEEFKLNFPIVLDTDNQVASTYKAFAIPTTYFIDKNGIIVDKVSGIVDPKTLEEKFENLLSK